VREEDDGQRERYACVCVRTHTRTHSHIRASARTATTAAAREVQRRALEPEVRGMARALTWSVKICSPYFSAISWGKLYLHDARKSRTHRARERLCGAPKRAPARMHCRHGGRTLLPCRQQRNASQACAFRQQPVLPPGPALAAPLRRCSRPAGSHPQASATAHGCRAAARGQRWGSTADEHTARGVPVLRCRSGAQESAGFRP